MGGERGGSWREYERWEGGVGGVRALINGSLRAPASMHWRQAGGWLGVGGGMWLSQRAILRLASCVLFLVNILKAFSFENSTKRVNFLLIWLLKIAKRNVTRRKEPSLGVCTRQGACAAHNSANALRVVAFLFSHFLEHVLM